MTTIIHVDINSYFASLEQARKPWLKGKPVCVAGKGKNERTVCAAFSYEAKKYGLKSGDPVWEAKRKCPKIIVLEADYPFYQETSRKFFQILETFTPWVEIFSIDEGFMRVDSYEEAITISSTIKEKIKKEIGLTVSIGIAPNKLLAKMASESKKPDGLTVIYPKDVLSFLGQSQLEDIPGIGTKVLARLKKIAIETVLDLQKTSFEKLKGEFGPASATFLKETSLGKYKTEFVPFSQMPQEKSIGHSYTLPKDLSERNTLFKKEVAKVLYKLAEKVGVRLRKRGLKGKVITIYLRLADFSGFSRQESLSQFIDDGFAIYQTGKRILEKVVHNKPIRLIGISISGLRKKMGVPLSLFEETKWEKISSQIDLINTRFGEFTVYPAAIHKIKERILNIPDGRSKRLF